MPLKPLRTPSESDGKRSVAFGWQHSTLRLSVSAYAMPISTYPVGQTHVPCFVPLRASRVCKQRSLTTSKKSTTGFCDHKEAPEKDIFLNSVCVCAPENSPSGHAWSVKHARGKLNASAQKWSAQPRHTSKEGSRTTLAIVSLNLRIPRTRPITFQCKRFAKLKSVNQSSRLERNRFVRLLELNIRVFC